MLTVSWGRWMRRYSRGSLQFLPPKQSFWTEVGLVEPHIQKPFLWLAPQFIDEGTPQAQQAAFRRITTDVEDGRVELGDVVQDIERPRQTEAGDFGLEGIAASVIALVVPAIYSFLQMFAKNLGEKLAEESADFVLKELKKRLSDSKHRPVIITDIRAAFDARAKELDLTSDSYEDMLRRFEEGKRWS